MKYFSDKCGPKMTVHLHEEFADDFFEIEDIYAKTELAGGPITQSVIKSKDDMNPLKNMPL
ncbi:MAG: hypothetical protein FWG67_07310 [Defluviitaleaceae bacterium]|nr:hypothetical protein [Defluviitaleaceae bacterium]